jgi:hypothetical protein
MGLFAIQEYIFLGQQYIFVHELTLIQFTRPIDQSSRARTTGAEMASTAVGARKTLRSLDRNFKISRAEEYRKTASSLSV